MVDQRKLLVVDDEEVVCQACRRIFSRQGFQVETYTDPRHGLANATANDYAIILLDIKMPNMDGIQFLERLREKKPDVPVLIITGYPSIPNAAAAMRLGACDYVTKPFTSEEIMWAMQRVLKMQHVLSDEGKQSRRKEKLLLRPWPISRRSSGMSPGCGLPSMGRRAWGRCCRACAGPRLRASVCRDRRGRLPGPAAGRGQRGRQAYADHPVANLRRCRGREPDHGPASPAVGQRSLRGRLDRLHLHDAARRNGELQAAAPVAGQRGPLFGRRADPETHGLGLPGPTGCRTADVLLAALADSAERAVFLDANSLGEAGPDLVECINRQAPHAAHRRVGSAGGAGEAAYRKHKIFYYAVEPFSDNEIADILMGAFQTREVQPAKAERQKGLRSRSAASRSPTATCTKWSCWQRRGCCGPTKGLG